MATTHQILRVYDPSGFSDLPESAESGAGRLIKSCFYLFFDTTVPFSSPLHTLLPCLLQTTTRATGCPVPPILRQRKFFRRRTMRLLTNLFTAS